MSLDEMFMDQSIYDQDLMDDQCGQDEQECLDDARELYRYSDIDLQQYMKLIPESSEAKELRKLHISN